MREVTKVMMCIYRVHKNEAEFYVRYDEDFDRYILLTGHVESGETLEEAARRETDEEINAEILKIEDLEYSRIVTLQSAMKISHEHAFLFKCQIRITNFLKV